MFTTNTRAADDNKDMGIHGNVLSWLKKKKNTFPYFIGGMNFESAQRVIKRGNSVASIVITFYFVQIKEDHIACKL